MRKINITIEIEDSDFVEDNLYKLMNSTLGSSLKDYTVLSNTQLMYEKDSNFRKIIKGYRDIKRVRDNYINEHNHKFTNEIHSSKKS